MIYKSTFAAIALVALTLPTVLADAPPVPGEPAGTSFFVKDQRKPVPIGSVRGENEAKDNSRVSVTARTKDGKVHKLYGYDALSYSVMSNDVDALKRLLRAGVHDLDAGARRGEWTLLQAAVHRGTVETTSLLLQHGADPNLAQDGTPLPLELAERDKQAALADLLREHGARRDLTGNVAPQ